MSNKPADLFSQVYDQSVYTLHVTKWPLHEDVLVELSNMAKAILVPLNSAVLTYIKRDAGFVAPRTDVAGLVGFFYTVPVIVNCEKTYVKRPQIVFKVTTHGHKLLWELETC